MDQRSGGSEISVSDPANAGAATVSRIALVIRHLWELSDSIGYDCLGQFRILREWAGDKVEVRIFCEHRNGQHYGDIPTEPIGAVARVAWRAAGSTRDLSFL